MSEVPLTRLALGGVEPLLLVRVEAMTNCAAFYLGAFVISVIAGFWLSALIFGLSFGVTWVLK